MLIKQLLKLRESDNADGQLALWKEAVKKKYPEVASKLKFKSKDQGKHISAEIDGQDRSYGVFDVAACKGEVLGEAECKFKKGDVLRVKKSALAKLKKADPKATFKDDATGKVKDTPFGGTKITFSKDLNGKKMWATSDLEAVPVSEETITEASDKYEDSSEFTDEFFGVGQELDKLIKIVEAKRWASWMKLTDQNYGTKAVPANDRFETAINAAKAAFERVVKEIEKADE